MNALSSYLQYLPPVLGSPNDAPGQPPGDARRHLLGEALCIFEKILTGIDDPVVIGDSEKSYLPIEALIDALPSFFNPWRTPAQDFLPWLATWVALDHQSDWSEYQRRKITAQIVSVYRMRGLAQGLYTYLDIYTPTKARPRIVIDEGRAVLRLRFLEDGTVGLTTVTHSQVVGFPEAPARPAAYWPVLIHPTAIAIDKHNDYFIVDQGFDEGNDPAALRKPALWKISSTGEIAYAQGAPLSVPQSLRSDVFFKDATAAVVDDHTDAVSIISIGGDPPSGTSQRTILQRFPPPDYAPVKVIDQTTTPRLPVVRPVDMVLDGDRHFVILDRGVHLFGDPPTAPPAAPRMVVVGENPLSVETHLLAGIVEPTALVQAPDGTFIVADAKLYTGAEPADLWQVNPSNGWTAVSLLGALSAEANPLIFPTGIVFDAPTVLLVCDTGLRWGFKENQSNRAMAEPPAIYRIDLGRTPPVVTRLTREPGLVNPAKIVRDRQGKYIVIDAGESLQAPQRKRNWRARPNEIGVIVHFSQQRKTVVTERNRTRRGITGVLNEQKPGHLSWWLKSD